MEESVKIAKIKKSCKVGKTISNILFIISLIAGIASLAGGIFIFSMGREFDVSMEKAVDAGYVTTDNSMGSATVIRIEAFDVDNLHSDIPSWQAAIEDHPYAISYGAMCLTMAAALVLAAVLMKLISGIFAQIIKEETPFTDKVIKRVLVVMIAVSAVMFFTTGMAYGVLGGIVTWVVYSILDYGKTLQIQSDETL